MRIKRGRTHTPKAIEMRIDIIRSATVEDFEAAVTLYSQLLDRAPWFSMDFFSECLRRKDQYLAMARKSGAGKAVGLIAWTVWPEGLSFGRKVCFIQDLVVAPDEQKQGIGSALLTFVKTWAMSHGIRVMHLQTSKDENLRFFRKNGFELCNHGLYQTLGQT